MTQIYDDYGPGKYIFQESLSQIIDNEAHPLHNTYIEALATIKQPCSHEPAILGYNPKDLFDERTMEDVEKHHQAHQIPKMDDMCGDFKRDYQLYAFLGSGSFGAVFAARTTRRGEDGKYLHVAVKFCPIRLAMKQSGGLIRYGRWGIISNEVLALALLRDNPGVPKAYAIYAHGCTLISVIELFAVWPDTDELESLPPFNFKHNPAKIVRLQTCDGNELAGTYRSIPGYKEVEEMDVCKMSTIHLSTLQSMKERGCSHDDIAHRNIIINENYDVKLIDWGASQVHPSEEGWFNNRFVTNHEIEFRPPEWVLSGRNLLPSRKGRIVDDHRRYDLWRMSCLVYYYLHHNFPFQLGIPKAERKWAVRYGELKIKDSLTQDCSDALMAMLEQNPQSRGKTEDLATLPWNSGFYVDTDYEFRNVMHPPFVPRKYSNLDISRGSKIRDTVHRFNMTFYGDRIVRGFDSLYRCFAQWALGDQTRWQEIRANTLLHYQRFTSGLSADTSTPDDAAQLRVYRQINRRIPEGVERCLQRSDLLSPPSLIRIIADALSCQAVLVIDDRTLSEEDEPDLHIYGNVHERRPPHVFQIHLYYDVPNNAYDLVQLHHHDWGNLYLLHAHPDMDTSIYGLDDDHRANIEAAKARERRRSEGLPRELTPHKTMSRYYDWHSDSPPR
ncbi:hypothetical protein FGG08_003989 [Glutinoglossum americanum]|uniref:EKC/KEOPS complex subunit BUD32 n=1 Tax=Glutinoglossum americanum TaxID=1670608 RepID=A0A9P8I5Y7_9PEZI|nr:hypothetical protein FGG08_003989 [Glutinoglossum americanum]